MRDYHSNDHVNETHLILRDPIVTNDKQFINHNYLQNLSYQLVPKLVRVDPLPARAQANKT